MAECVIWVSAGLVLLVLEVLIPGVFMMWLGLAAVGTGLLTLALTLGFGGQVLVFGVLTLVTLTIGLRTRRPRAVMNTEREGLIGRAATALVFRGRDGRVRVGDSDWTARVPADIEPPDPGARMRVEQVDGTTLIVRPDA